MNNSSHITHITHDISHMKMRSHRDLDAWKKSMDLVDNVYKVTKSFPNEELYSLTNQMRRAAISIPSNIAEGAARGSKKEFMNNSSPLTDHTSHITDYKNWGKNKYGKA